MNRVSCGMVVRFVWLSVVLQALLIQCRRMRPLQESGMQPTSEETLATSALEIQTTHKETLGTGRQYDVAEQEVHAARLKDPLWSIADALKLGFEAINEGVQPFSDTPPNVRKGLQIFDEKLWKVVLLLTPMAKHGSPEMLKVKEHWDTAFQDLPAIYGDVQTFTSQGDTLALTRAIANVTDLPLSLLAESYPETGPYFRGISDMLWGVSESWDSFFKGNATTCLEAVWKATKVAMSEVLPTSLIHSESMGFVMGTVDTVMGDLDKHIVEYKNAILQATTCYKNNVRRSKTRPQLCRQGFVWDGGHRCLPLPHNGANCWQPCGEKAGRCSQFCGAGKVCCRKGVDDSPDCNGAYGYTDNQFTAGTSKDYHQCVYEAGFARDQVREKEQGYEDIHDWIDVPAGVWSLAETNTTRFSDVSGVEASSNDVIIVEKQQAVREDSNRSMWWGHDPHTAPTLFGTHPARCNPQSTHSEINKNGQYCMSRCPEGFKPSGTDRCVQLCSSAGKFKAEGPEVGGIGYCGLDAATVVKNGVEMGVKVVWGAVNIGTLVADMHNNGMDVDKLAATINSFIDMGKALVKPMCPTEGVLFPEDQMGESPAFLLSGCGMHDLNGKWKKEGWTRGRPRYEKIGDEDLVMEWSDGRHAWRVYDDDTFFPFGRKDLYLSSENTVTAPQTGWVAINGEEPPPTVLPPQRGVER